MCDLVHDLVHNLVHDLVQGDRHRKDADSDIRVVSRGEFYRGIATERQMCREL